MVAKVVSNESEESLAASAEQVEMPAVVEPPAKGEDHEEQVGNKFAKIRKERNEARQAAEAARQEAADLKARIEALERPKTPDGEPDPTKFTDAVEYGKAYGKWLAAKETKEFEAKKAKEERENEEAHRVETWTKRLKKFSKDVEDFDEVSEAANNMRVADNIRNAIMESELGPQLYYYLATHEDELEDINALPAAKRLIAFGKLEDRLERANKKVDEPVKGFQVADITPRRRVAEPPEPITPINGKNSVTTGWQDGDNYQAFKAAYKAGQFKR